MSSTQPEIARLTRSQITEKLLWLDGKPICLDDFPMHRAFYDGAYKKTLLMTCRQVAKSTTLCNFIVADSIAIPYFKTLFFSPSQEQTLKFSNLRVGKTLNYSPLLRKYWLAENRVLSRTYRNGSENAFSYATDDPDRLRGNSADRLLGDEIQDVVTDVVLPVARECMGQSDYQYEMYSGTPKTLDNPIHGLWNRSTKTEWCMRCEHCNAWNYIDTEKNFEKLGPVCLKCKGLLNPRKGVWVDMNPGAEYKGFHISQAIMPRNVPACWQPGTERHAKAVERWEEILLKRKNYPISTFRNEVVGVSDSQGVRLVTMEDLLSMCTGPESMPIRPDQPYMMGIQKVAAGIDWGGGGKDQTSRTVLWIWGLQRDRRLRCLYYQVFVGEHVLTELDKIKQILAFYQPEVICCDAGEGNLHTEELRRKTGWHHKIYKVCYGGGSASIKWDQQGNQLSVNRTKAIDSLMMWLLRKEAVFSKNRERMEPAFKDVLAEHVEITRTGKKIWNHSPSDPDDSLHAMVFGRLAMQMATGELDLTA